MFDRMPTTLRRVVVAQSPETVCAEVMGEMVGREPARDDIALLIIRRRPDETDTVAARRAQINVSGN